MRFKTISVAAMASHAALLGFLSVPSSAHEQEPVTASFNIPYSALSPRQKDLFRGYFHQSKCTGSLAEVTGTEEQKFEEFWTRRCLNESQKLIFFAITHALSRTLLKDGGNALSLIEEVQEINGIDRRGKSARQANLRVLWKTNAHSVLKGNGFKHRVGQGHRGESGIQKKNPGEGRGLHVLFYKDRPNEGHVHIDYRSSGGKKIAQYARVGQHYGNYGLSQVTGFIGLRHPFGQETGHYEYYNGYPAAIGPEKGPDHEPISNLELHMRWYGREGYAEIFEDQSNIPTSAAH